MRESYTLGAPPWNRGVSFIMFLLGIIGAMTFTSPLAIIVPALVPPLFYVLVAVLGTLRFEVGTDGVTMRRRLGRGRYVPYTNLDSACRDGGAVVLKLREGTELRYEGDPNPFSNGRRADSVHLPLEGVIVETIEDARKSAATPRGHERASLRGEAAEALRSRRAPECSPAIEDYRAAAPTPLEELDRIVSDPHSAEQERGAAAVLLRVRDPERARIRLSDLSNETASPKLRALLETAAAEEVDDAVLSAALEEIPTDHRG